MGIFSENVDSLRYFGKTHSTINYNNKNINYFELVDLNDAMPEDYRMLKMFKAIVINNCDTEMLNSNQQEALKDWVQSGGLLLIGTGPNYQKTLKGLENINFIDIHGTKEINISELGLETVIDAELSEGEEVIIDDKEELSFYHKEIGKGHVVIASFDLGLKPFGNWNENDKFMNEVIDKYLLKEDIDNNYGNIRAIKYSNHWFNNIVSYLPYNLLPSIKTIIIILIIFILLVGPINYVALKRLDKRELIWLTIPLIVIMLSASIYVLGFRTRLRQPIANNVSIIDVNAKNNMASITTKSGLMGFKNGDWNIEFDKESDVFLEDRDDYDILQRFGDKEIVTEYILDKEKHLILNKAGILDVQTVTIEDEVEFESKIDTDFKLEEGRIVGQVNNLSDLNLEDVVIFYGNSYKKVGDLKAGEKSKEIILYASKSNTVKDWYAVIDSLYGGRSYSFNKANDDKDDILNKNIKRDILEGLFRSTKSSINKNRFFMIAWNREAIGNDIKINSKTAKRLDRNVIVLPINIQYEKGANVKIPYGVLQPEILDIHNMNLEEYNSMIFGDGYVVLGYKAHENMMITSMKIDFGLNKYKYRGEVYIYDFIKEDWEKSDKNDIKVDASNMDKYYDENKGTLIKIDPTDDIDIYIPNYTVEGVIK